MQKSLKSNIAREKDERLHFTFHGYHSSTHAVLSRLRASQLSEGSAHLCLFLGRCLFRPWAALSFKLYFWRFKLKKIWGIWGQVSRLLTSSNLTFLLTVPEFFQTNLGSWELTFEISIFEAPSNHNKSQKQIEKYPECVGMHTPPGWRVGSNFVLEIVS